MIQSELKLPVYHDLGMEMRYKYNEFTRLHGFPVERATAPYRRMDADLSPTPSSHPAVPRPHKTERPPRLDLRRRSATDWINRPL